MRVSAMTAQSDDDDAGDCPCLYECECPGRREPPVRHVCMGGLSRLGAMLVGLTGEDLEEVPNG